LSCHQGKHANFERSAHSEGNVSCIGCHQIHNSKGEPLLKAPQATLCFECHTGTEPQFAMAFHHKVNEGLVQCTDCHDPHGAVEAKSLQQVARQNAACVKCHAGAGGPFTYEHLAVKTEGCTACHTPHGGPNARMLNRAKVNSICLQCHSPAVTPATSAHSQTGQTQPCTTCHTGIHGSNVSPVLLNENPQGGSQR
jgi:DmsE family decaheme c-type cytochrome